MFSLLNNKGTSHCGDYLRAARRFALTGLFVTRSNLLRDIFPWRRHNELTHQRPGAAIEHMKAAGFVSPLCQK